MRLILSLLWLLTAAAAAVAADADRPPPLRIAVAAPADPEHFAWAPLAELERRAAGAGIPLTVEPAPPTSAQEATFDILVLPVRSLAGRVPSLQVLELPFLFPSLAGVRAAVDGTLGEQLAADAFARGWKILAFWDEGMHILSGLKRYDRVRSLKAREFLVTRPDPIAERQFQYWKADVRRITPESREAVLRECLIASRATTLHTVMLEQLYRVHLAMSLSNHRYEGWLVIAPRDRWSQVSPKIQYAITGLLSELTQWQRRDIDRREAENIGELKRAGMDVYEVDSAEREAFRSALPEWGSFVSDDLSRADALRLVEMALSGAAVAVPAPPPSHQATDGAPVQTNAH